MKSRFLPLKGPKENLILGKANLDLRRKNFFPGKEIFLLGAPTFFLPEKILMLALIGFTRRKKCRFLEKQVREREKQTWFAGKKTFFWEKQIFF